MLLIYRSDQLGGQYADHYTSETGNFCGEGETKPLLRDLGLERNAAVQRDVSDVAPSGVDGCNNASSGSCVNYAQLQPL